MSRSSVVDPLDVAPLEQNLRLYRHHQLLVRSLLWMPVFELFTTARFGLDRAVALASAYYLAVVVLEVPTGWFSDRWGRVPTLRLAALSWTAAQACFLTGWLVGDGVGLVPVAAGQILLAAGYACLSGTDVAFHQDTLEALGREDELAAREARLAAVTRGVGAVSLVVGGGLGTLWLPAPFLGALVAALAQLVIASRLSEPARSGHAGRLTTQVRACLGHFRDRLLAWLACYGVALVTLEHVAGSLSQPWLVEALGRDLDDLGPVPLLAGVVAAAGAPLAMLAARLSVPARDRFGLVPTLLALAAVSATVVSGMALWVRIGVLALFAFRSVQSGAATVLLETEVVGSVGPAQRATVLSLMSLGGRLGYGLVLAAVAGRAGDGIRSAYQAQAVVAWILVVALAAAAVALTVGRRATATSRRSAA